jgi:hypothetical protein
MSYDQFFPTPTGIYNNNSWNSSPLGANDNWHSDLINSSRLGVSFARQPSPSFSFLNPSVLQPFTPKMQAEIREAWTPWNARTRSILGQTQGLIGGLSRNPFSGISWSTQADTYWNGVSRDVFQHDSAVWGSNTASNQIQGTNPFFFSGF